MKTAFRPRTLDEYVGQEKAKENLKIYIEAAKQRGEALDHSAAIRPFPVSVRRHLQIL